ncbi:MAG: CdaR family protein [Oscillospiraceae bacterium]|nr:CdaR family protein [Oscillospiraceae bacterium]
MDTKDTRKKEGKTKKGASLLTKIQASFIFRLFTSLILAVFIWLTINATYVNPPGSPTINRPLSLRQRSSLENNGLELRTETFPSDVDILIKGRQEDIDKLTPSDFDVFIDFSDVSGVDDTSLEVQLNAPKAEAVNVAIVSIEPSVVPIEVERRTFRNVSIQVQFSGELAEGFILTGHTRNPSTKYFTARESLISQIDRVEVEVDLTGIAGNTVVHQQCRIYNTDGEEMNRLGWEQVVEISLEVSKDVPIRANIIGSPADDHYVRYYSTTPEIARINGTKEALEQVDSLDTDVLDLNDSRQSISGRRALLLPNNIRLSQDTLSRAEIDVTIYRYQYTQDFTLSKGRIELINNQEEFRYEIVENEIPLTLKGKVDDIADLDSNLINAVADVGELAQGTHAVPAVLTLPEGVFQVNDVLLTLIVATN